MPAGIVVWLVTRATLPAPAAIGMVPVTSGAGSATPHGNPPQLFPVASCTSRYPPGGIEPARFVRCQFVPAVAAYWTLHVDTSTALVPRLNSSMKSLWYVAPAFPPPP